jgi:hypothetical protein
MVWLHPALLFGLLLTALPVLLHLLMRAKPKKLVFPALRLIQNRKRTNVRRLKLRHLALLLLRMGVLALLAIALARPSVPATDYSLGGADWLRLALLAVVVTAAYRGMLALWRRRNLPPHELAYRRSFLCAGLAVAGVIAFAALIAWPYERRIAAAITQPTLAPSEFLPVAAVLLFDTSLSMQYQREGRTRLEVAQEIASKHLASLPRSSRVAIADIATDAPLRFQTDLSAAIKRIAALTAQPISRPLDDRLLSAIEAQLEDQDRGGDEKAAAAPTDLLREIYVFTDLAVSAWRKEGTTRLSEALARASGVSVYLIDVGVAAPTNLALTELALMEQSIPRGSEAGVRVTLEAIGIDAGERIVELHVENDAGEMIKQGFQSVKVDPQSAAVSQFSVRATGGPILQGEIRLLASDPLAFDDVRSFTLRIQPPVNVLIVAETYRDAVYLTDAIESLGAQKYRPAQIPAAKLASTDLSKYAIVCLLNVADPTDAGWMALGEFVTTGGCALVVLGDRVKQESYLSPPAQALLPAEPAAPSRFDPPEFLDFRNLTHPLLKKFADWPAEGLTSLTAEPIREYWRVKPAEQDAAVIATYTDVRRTPAPAFVERAHGKGRTLLLTTSLDRRWSDLPVAGWFVVLVDQMLGYLSNAGGEKFNFMIGDPVAVTLESGRPLPAYLLRKPGLQQLRGDVPPGTTRLHVQDVDQIGNYRLTSADAPPEFERGFSVNPNRGESDLRRLTKEELDARLGADRYSLAADIDHLQRNVRAGRLGREAFPLLALLLLAAFLGEHFIANYFYDAEPPPQSP